MFRTSEAQFYKTWVQIVWPLRNPGLNFYCCYCKTNYHFRVSPCHPCSVLSHKGLIPLTTAFEACSPHKANLLGPDKDLLKQSSSALPWILAGKRRCQQLLSTFLTKQCIHLSNSLLTPKCAITHRQRLVELTWDAKWGNASVKCSWIQVTLRNALYVTTIYVLYLWEMQSFPEIIPGFFVKFSKRMRSLTALLLWRKK